MRLAQFLWDAELLVGVTAAAHHHFAVLGLGARFVAIDGDVADFFGRRALLAVAGRGRLRRFLRDGDRGRGRGDQREGSKRTEHEQSPGRSEEHTSELQSLMRNSYAVFCLNKKKKTHNDNDQKINRARKLAHKYRNTSRPSAHCKIKTQQNTHNNKEHTRSQSLNTTQSTQSRSTTHIMSTQTRDIIH